MRVVDPENLNVRDPALHDALRMHDPESRLRCAGTDLELDLDCRIAHVATVEPERRHKEVNPSLDAVAVIEEHHTRKRRVMIEGRNARPAAEQLGDGPGRIGAALEVDVLARQEVRRWPAIGDSKALGPYRYCLAADEDDRAGQQKPARGSEERARPRRR